MEVTCECPFCGDLTRQEGPIANISSSITLTVVRGSIFWPFDLGSRDALIVVTCRCVEDPRSEPSKSTKVAVSRADEKAKAGPELQVDEFGCGRSWMVRVHYRARLGAFKHEAEPIHVYNPQAGDRVLWPSVVAIQSASAEALEQGRASAAKWQTALTGLITLVGLSAVLGGRDSLAKMDKGVAISITIGLGVVLILAALAAWTAQKAVTGSAINDQADRQAGVGAYRAGAAHELGVMRRRLRTAAQLTLAAFLGGLVVIGSWLLAPTATTSPPTPPKVAVTSDSGKTYSCATLLKAEDQGSIVFQSRDGDRIVLPADEVVRIEPSSC